MIIGGLYALLSAYKHIEVAGMYTTGEQLLCGLQKQQPDVLLLDIQLPDKTGDKLAPVILKKYPHIRILIITNLNSALYIHNMFRLGVSGYVLKNADPESIIKAIETVYRGEHYLTPDLKDKLDHFTFIMKKQTDLQPSLTAKEKEVLRLTVNGYTTQEISEQLFLGVRTIEYYRSNLLLKLEVKNMAALIRKALELGLT
jgi:DNA-binding NarL/FixJ family response regulator